MDVCERVNSGERRLSVEQIATVVALGCGRQESLRERQALEEFSLIARERQALEEFSLKI